LIEIKGCRFHLGQSWWKKIQSLVLTNVYRDQKSEHSTFLRVFFGLPFLSPNDVDQCFVEDIMAIQPTGDKIQALLDYVFETYIDPSGLFPPDVWAELNATTNITTNVCESFHSRLNGMFNCSHPNIYNFIDILKDIQINTNIKIRSKEVIKMKKTTIQKTFFLRQEMLKYQNKKFQDLNSLRAYQINFYHVHNNNK